MAKVARVAICHHCNGEFQPRSNRAKWCTRTCQMAGKPAVDCANPNCDRQTQNGTECSRCAARRRRNGHYDELEWTQPESREADAGYWRRYVGHSHPVANATGYAYVHRLVMSEMIGRPVLPGETVHHINGDRADNRPENLELWAKNHGPGQRVTDIVDDVLDRYPDLVRQKIHERQEDGRWDTPPRHG